MMEGIRAHYQYENDLYCLQYSFEHTVVCVIVWRAVDGKLYCLKAFSKLLNFILHCLRHNIRRIRKCPAAKGPLDNDIVAFLLCDLQYSMDSLLQ